MQLGWIDFSKSERSKVLDVLKLLEEKGTIDELGIAPIRDGFSNLFFPGTSTIQTRAKYFFIVPYALKDLELSEETNKKKLVKELTNIEKSCGKSFSDSDQSDKEGIIGIKSLLQDSWVKRSPADIYWSGLRKYGIFIGGNLSLSEYIHAICKLKEEKNNPKKLGSKNDNAEEGEKDDKNAGGYQQMHFWNIQSLYKKNWKDNLKLNLEKEEAKFLSEQIIKTCPNTMLSFILEKNLKEVIQCQDFNNDNFEKVVEKMPSQMQNDYDLAKKFSYFNYVLRIIYNGIVSNDKNKTASDELAKYKHEMPQIADVDIGGIFTRLQIPTNNSKLREFLVKTQELMTKRDINGLKEEIIEREKNVKKGESRAKTSHPGEFDTNAWFGGGLLDYRFLKARQIIKDIFESEENDA